MLKSMTGYGKGSVSVAGKTIKAEVRSLNSKQLDLSVKSPSVYRTLDTEIRALSQKTLQRGKADVYITVENQPGQEPSCVNEELFGANFALLKRLSKLATGRDAGEVLDSQLIASVLRMPDVISTKSENVEDEEAEALLFAVRQALEDIDNFRKEEGKCLRADILSRVELIEQSVPKVEPYEQERVAAVKQRIMENLEKLSVQVDVNRLEQEMIYYLEKFDITEEKVRLCNHCRYFREVADTEENPGRKLGFIAQEMGREINTLGSKANNAEIQKIVVGMKDELEKIKEQLLNIL